MCSVDDQNEYSTCHDHRMSFDGPITSDSEISICKSSEDLRCITGSSITSEDLPDNLHGKQFLLLLDSALCCSAAAARAEELTRPRDGRTRTGEGGEH